MSNISISDKLFLENQSNNLGLKLAHFFIKIFLIRCGKIVGAQIYTIFFLESKLSIYAQNRQNAHINFSAKNLS